MVRVYIVYMRYGVGGCVYRFITTHGYSRLLWSRSKKGGRYSVC